MSKTAIGNTSNGAKTGNSDKWPKGAELAKRVAAAVHKGVLMPVDLYTLLMFALDDKSDMGCEMTAARGVDLRDNSLSVNVADLAVNTKRSAT